jgi:hypothetical protein
VFVLLGAATAFVALSPPVPANHTDSQTTTWSWTVGAGDEFVSPALWGLNGSLVLSWSSDVPLNVSLAQTAPCAGGPPCRTIATLAQWSDANSGRWNTTNAEYPYVLNVTDAFSTPADVSCVEVSTADAATSSALPVGTFAALLAAGATLLTLGVVAIFLGLFLGPNVYGRRRSPPAAPGTQGPELGWPPRL